MNVLNEEKKQQVLTLRRLGWSLTKIEEATGIRRETAGSYLRSAGIDVRRPGGWGRPTRSGVEAAKPAIKEPTNKCRANAVPSTS